MKLLIDMNLSPSWVEFFAASGFESIHWSKVGLPTAPDCVIMDYAAANGFVIFTHDPISAPFLQTGNLGSLA